jgi:triosephosphate isomerase
MALLTVAALLHGTDIGLGAQDMHWEEKGAYTGEVAPSMVAEFCKYVIIGHSERRTYFNETDDSVNRKTTAALKTGLVPIICVGESLEEYESRQTAEVIAYEPVWAIGTGRASTSENANAVISQFIRKQMAVLFGETIAQDVRVLYGGSVTADNANDFFSQADIDGALVGGASLKVTEFLAIVHAAAKRA